MPNFFNFNFIERFPIPSLRNYAGFSAILLVAVLYYSYDTVVNDESWQVEFKQKIVDNGLSETTRDWLLNSTIARVLYFLLTDQVCIWTVVNTACCSLVLMGKVLQNVVFGRLRLIEHQQMRDRFWNFVFYKFVFVFGVMNVQFFDEVFLWSIWFAVCGFFFLLTTLAQDRFKYVSSSPTTSRSTNVRILIFLSVILFCAIGLFSVAVIVSAKYGLNYGGFLAAECILLLLRVTHGILRYGVHLYDTNKNLNWEERSTFIYYTDLIFELLILFTDFIHHIHMLIWSNIFLSMASLVICMQLKHLYQEIDRRLRRHRNYQRIVNYIDSKYPMATVNDLSKHDDKCAICWDHMETARKLTCGHMFHNWCLHGWLEQDTSCPTCRTTLSINPPPTNNEERHHHEENNQVQRRRHRTNHFFHFDGRRYARWLPSFSVEVSHNIGRPALLRRNSQPTNSQLTRMAEQVRELFPAFPVNFIEEDLRVTNNVEMTVDNILSGRLSADSQNQELNLESDVELESQSEYESDNMSSSSDSSAVREELHDDQEQQPSTSGQVNDTTHRASADPVNDPSKPSTSTDVETSQALVASATDTTLTPTPTLTGFRFSKCTEEREYILESRKRRLIDEHRRKYIDSPRGEDLRASVVPLAATGAAEVQPLPQSAGPQLQQQPGGPQLQQQSSGSRPGQIRDDNHARRRMLYNAAQRHLPPIGASNPVNNV